MSNFILNLVQRGAGLTPAVVHPSFAPVFPPAHGIADTQHSRPEAITVDEVPGETATPSAPAPTRLAAPGSRHALAPFTSQSLPADATDRQGQQFGTEDAAGPQPHIAQAPLPPIVPTPAVSPLGSLPEERPLSTAQPEPGTAPVAPATAATPIRPQRIAATPSPAAPAEEVSVSFDRGTAHRPTSEEDGAAPRSTFPTPPEPTIRLRMSPELFGQDRTIATVTQAVPDGTPVAPVAPIPESTTKVPSIAPRVTLPQAIVRPAPAIEAALPFPMSPERTITPAEPRAIHVRIGTIEVRATTPPTPPPPPAPTPQGFDGYALVRSYMGWGQD